MEEEAMGWRTEWRGYAAVRCNHAHADYRDGYHADRGGRGEEEEDDDRDCTNAEDGRCTAAREWENTDSHCQSPPRGDSSNRRKEEGGEEDGTRRRNGFDECWNGDDGEWKATTAAVEQRWEDDA
mmetsp:Transcript_40723/g.74505  ORF Transcript_40723/g.74505 Transcript_40723/m.74505 type:complete len:125 (+) Transcript_40723:150-524(+)